MNFLQQSIFMFLILCQQQAAFTIFVSCNHFVLFMEGGGVLGDV
jgi:hypothetical protein